MNRDFIRVDHSRIDGTGVFAKRRIPRGTRIVEYTGKRIPIGETASRYTLAVDEATAIDGAQDGNEARFVNHSCEPNCETYVFDGRAYLYAMRDVAQGEELTFDYKLAPAPGADNTGIDAEDYRCRCGSVTCRGTLLTLTGDAR
jgi:hypothetical protein